MERVDMSDELKAAAARQRRLRDGEPITQAYRAFAHSASGIYGHERRDRDLVLDAVLREHDETPVDAQWLRSIGFVENENCDEDYIPGTRLGLHWMEVHFDRGYSWVSHKENVIVNKPTRGQLRRLCSVLGFALKEPT